MLSPSRRYGVGDGIATADVVLAVHVQGTGDNAAATGFFDLREGAGQFGHHPASQTLLGLRAIQGDFSVVAGIVLEYITLPFCPTNGRVRDPMRRVHLGRLQAFAQDEWAKHALLEMVRPEAGLKTSVSKIKIEKLLFSDRNLRQIEITGIDDSFDPIVVDLTMLPEDVKGVVAKLKKGSVAQRKAMPAPGVVTDFLAGSSAGRKPRFSHRAAEAAPAAPPLGAEPSASGEASTDVLAALGMSPLEVPSLSHVAEG